MPFLKDPVGARLQQFEDCSMPVDGRREFRHVRPLTETTPNRHTLPEPRNSPARRVRIPRPTTRANLVGLDAAARGEDGGDVCRPERPRRSSPAAAGERPRPTGPS